MISCEEALELISLELDGLLEEARRNSLEEHLNRCAPCRALREDLFVLRHALPRLEEDPPEELVQAVLEALPRRRSLWRSPGFRSLAGLAACALLCVGLWQARPAPEAEGEPAPQISLTAAAGQEGPVLRGYAVESASPELWQSCKAAGEDASFPQKARLPADRGDKLIYP